MSQKRVYIAGPMRGIPQFNFPAFYEAEAELSIRGWDVFNPAAHDAENGFNSDGLTGNEDLAGMGFDLRSALADDMAYITTMADAVAVLPGWEQSKGARAEVATALAIGLDVFTYPAGNDVVEVPSRRPRVTWKNVPTVEAAEGFDDGNGMTVTGEVRKVSSTGGAKGVKPEQYQSIPVAAMRELAEHFAKGAAKYSDHNYRKGYPWSSSFSALNRHLWAFWGGEDRDPETGSKHVIAVAWHALALATFMDEHPGFDDRYKPLFDPDPEDVYDPDLAERLVELEAETRTDT